MVVNSLFDIFCFISDDDSISYSDLRRLEKKVQRYFGDNMPKKYWIFPINPYVYIMSKTVCIQVPSYGNKRYRELLNELEHKLRQSFQCDVELFNGNTTFIIRASKEFDASKELLHQPIEVL